jgi:hypothetical protein
VVERLSVAEEVAGSSPVIRPIHSNLFLLESKSKKPRHPIQVTRLLAVAFYLNPIDSEFVQAPYEPCQVLP